MSSLYAAMLLIINKKYKTALLSETPIIDPHLSE